LTVAVKPDEVIAPPTKDLKAFVVETMKLEDPKEIARRAKAFSEKYPGTAREMLRRARDLMSEGPFFKSPFSTISAYRWTKFVRTMAHEQSERKNHPSQLGIFLFSVPRLAELGIVTNPQKLEKDGHKVWTAEWKKPLTEELFLSRPNVQYKVFVQSVKQLFPILSGEKFSSFMGRGAEGKKVTLSGMVALAHRAGVKGAYGWLSRPEQRSKFPHTTQAFLSSTGVF
jgi:hypothetical protein